MPVGCTVTIYEDHIILLKTPTSSTGVALIRAEQSGAGTAIAQLTPSTDCPYLVVPAGSYPVPIGVPASINDSVEYSFAYDLSAYTECGIALCGSLDIDVDNGLGCTATVSIPVYVWNACGVNDSVEQCGLILPNGIYLDVQDPSTWDAFLPIIANFGYNHPEPLDQEGRNYVANIGLSSAGCDIIDEIGANAQFNFDGEGHAFPITFDLSAFEECGTNILACEITITMDSHSDPIAAGCTGAGPNATITIPVYVTNSCPERSCPISWSTTAQVINKNAGATGSFPALLNNTGSSSVTVTFSSDCPYLVVPEPIEIAAGESGSIDIDYDITAWNLCVTQLCGQFSATVSYNDDVDQCTMSFNVSLTQTCAEPGSDDYLTRLYDDAGASSVEVNAACTSIAIVDESEFGSMGHALVNFANYRKITIRHLQTGTSYVMSSIADDGDQLISAAAAGVFSFSHAITLSGVFEVTICNVPTWSASADYQANDDVVWYDGLFYAAIADSQGVNPATSPLTATNWVAITEEEISEYSDKYCDTQSVVAFCNLNQCYATKYKRMACELDCNNLDLCKNKEWLDLMKLQFLLVALDEAIRENDMVAATSIYDKANSICTC